MTLKAGFNEVFFDNVTVPEENLVAKRGEGWSVANSVLGTREAPWQIRMQR